MESVAKNFANWTPAMTTRWRRKFASTADLCFVSLLIRWLVNKF